MKLKAIVTSSLVSLSLLPTQVIFAESSSVAEAFKNGKANTLLRYRLETVDQEGFDEEALASTLKGRLSFKTDTYKNWSLFTEYDTVVALGGEQYNSGMGTSGAYRAIYPVVADPDGSEVNQAYLAYSGFSDTTIKVGRQRILLDNQRFVGGVGWRQNEQTYDGLSVDTKVSGVGMKYAYITNVNRIFGEDVAAGGSKSNTHLLNVGKKFSAGQLTGYFYGIDNEDQLAFSTSTLGVKWAGKKLFGNPNFSYGLEYASQSDAADSPLDYTADYLRLDAAYKFKPVKFYVGYEVLGSDDGVAAFRTPLATLHAFNGWADKFLGTPNTGLEDVFVGISGQAGRFKWNAKYHDFTSDVNGLDFGNELDFSIGTKIAKNYNVLLKYADFSADDDGGSDVSKLWVMLQAKF